MKGTKNIVVPYKIPGPIVQILYVVHKPDVAYSPDFVLKP